MSENKLTLKDRCLENYLGFFIYFFTFDTVTDDVNWEKIALKVHWKLNNENNILRNTSSFIPY